MSRTFVLDTSVLLSDPRAMLRFAEHAVVLPVVVITELEAKRHHAELGYFARSALRTLDDLRIRHGRLDEAVPVGDAGGMLRVELNHIDQDVLPAGFRLGDNDSRILAVAKNLSDEGHDVTLVSKDLPMRVKASAVGLAAEEYRHELAVDSGWTGMSELTVAEDQMAHLYESERLDLADVSLEGQDPGPLLCHTGVVVHSGRGSALARVTPDKQLRLVRGDLDAFGCTAAARSSASRSTCCSTRRSASSPSAAARGRASRPSRCVRGWRRCSSAASTARPWCSGRCTPSAARSSATCPAPRTRR